MNLNDNIAYIAGFIDGEGCIRIKKANSQNNSYYLTLQVTNSDRKSLALIKKRFGGNIYFQEKTKNKTIYQYYITCLEAFGLLKVLYPFLISKKKQAKLALNFQIYKDGKSVKWKREKYFKMRELKKC